MTQLLFCLRAGLASGKQDALDLYACDHLFPEDPAAPALLPTQPTNGAAAGAAPAPPSAASRFGAVLGAAKRQVRWCGYVLAEVFWTAGQVWKRLGC